MARTDQDPALSDGGRPDDVEAEPLPPLVKTSESGFDYIDYKDTETLGRHTTNNGKMQARRRNQLTAGQQRMLASAIKRARFMALLPYVETSI